MQDDNTPLYLPFSNEIDDLPPPDQYHRKIWKTPKEVQVEIDKDNENKEATFRKWLIKNKPHHSMMVPIETSTAIGIPDIWCCYNSFSSWIECKVLISGKVKIRGAQYIFLKRLVEAGGYGKVVVQKISPKTYKPVSIWIYDAADIATTPYGLFKMSNNHIYFPTTLKPWYVWNYNKDKDITIEDLYERLLLDKSDFI